MKNWMPLLLISLIYLIACDSNNQEEPTTIAEDRDCKVYTPFQEGWRAAYEKQVAQYQDCPERTTLLQAETDSLVVLGDSLGLYVHYLLLGQVDPVGGAYTTQLSPTAYPYLIASSNKGYWKAKLDIAIMKDRFGQQKTGASAIEDFEEYGAIFLEQAQAPDTTLIAALMEKYGWSKQLAGKQAVLVPIAFGRFFLEQQYPNLEFSPLYHNNDPKQAYPYTKDPVYLWARALAALETPVPLFSKEAVQAILDRSPEVQGVQELVAKGESLEGVELETKLVF